MSTLEIIAAVVICVLGGAGTAMCGLFIYKISKDYKIVERPAPKDEADKVENDEASKAE